MKKTTEQELIDKWIKELKEQGYDYDDMLRIFAKASDKYNDMILNDTRDIECDWEDIIQATKWSYNSANDMNAPNG